MLHKRRFGLVHDDVTSIIMLLQCLYYYSLLVHHCRTLVSYNRAGTAMMASP